MTETRYHASTMILYLFGEDSFSSRKYLRDSITEFKKQRDPKGYNTSILDGSKLPPGKLFAEINSAPFLAEKRLVAVENLLSSSDKEALAEFIERLKGSKIPDWVVLIVWQGAPISKVKEAKELHGMLAKEKYAREFQSLTGTKLVSWIQKEVELKGGTISAEAAGEIAGNLNDMWQISGVLNQLVAYKNREAITQADLSGFLEEKIDDNVFNLVDAVVSGNHNKAFRLLLDQRTRGEEDGHLFGLFIWQFKILLQMSDLLEREAGVTSDELAKRLKIHPFVAKKNFVLAKKYSLSKLESVYREMLQMDLKTKTGQADQSVLLDLFVAKM